MGNCISAVDNSVSDASDDSGFVFEGNANSVDVAPTYGVIYKVDCAKCQKIYIGESKNGRKRLKAHLVSNEDTNGFTFRVCILSSYLPSTFSTVVSSTAVLQEKT